jgi:hypothetical protein
MCHFIDKLYHVFSCPSLSLLVASGGICARTSEPEEDAFSATVAQDCVKVMMFSSILFPQLTKVRLLLTPRHVRYVRDRRMRERASYL